jgi:hypothetical protein
VEAGSEIEIQHSAYEFFPLRRAGIALKTGPAAPRAVSTDGIQCAATHLDPELAEQQKSDFSPLSALMHIGFFRA